MIDLTVDAAYVTERLKGELPDAILIDQLMPRLNGLEAIEIIHGNPRTAHLPVVICTTHENTEVAAVARQRGAAGTLTKSKAAEEIPELLVRLREIEAHWPPVHSAGLASTAQTVHQPAPELDPNRELLRLIEERIEARIEARLTGLIEPLLQDLERSLSEHLLASVRQLIDSQIVESHVIESRGLIESSLANGRQAAGLDPAKHPSTELESANGHLVVEPLPQVHNRMTPVYLAILGAVVFNLLVLFLIR